MTTLYLKITKNECATGTTIESVYLIPTAMFPT